MNKNCTIIKEAIEEVLNESSINRLEYWIKSKDIAAISAWCNNLENITKKSFIRKIGRTIIKYKNDILNSNEIRSNLHPHNLSIYYY